MDCDYRIHDELNNMQEPTCPFCDRLLVEVVKWLSHAVVNRIW